MSEKNIKKQVEAGQKAAEAKKKGRAGQTGKSPRKNSQRFPFKVDEGGVWKKIDEEKEDGSKRSRWVRFGTELHVQALTRNDESENWGRLLEVVDRDGNRHSWAMPAALLAGSGDQLRSELFGLGFELETRRDAKGWLLQYLTSSAPEERARCVSGIGWHGGTFVLPDGAIGTREDSEKIILQSTERLDHAFNIAGCLDDWKEKVAKPALGNSRLVLSISVAFAAPLLALSDDEGGGFHFKGASSSGKSTALNVAGSVWGGGGGTRGYVRNWRATGNALEGVSVMHRDCLLCLDEISQVDPKSAGEAAYMLANGKGKARAGREGQARKVLQWRLLFLSSGEIGLADKIKEGGGQMAAGMEVRVIDIRADAGAGMGLFEDIHEVDDPAAFSQALSQSSRAFYGTAGRSFVTKLVKDIPEHSEGLRELRRGFVDQVVPHGADGQVQRVADRFALVAAAGELATEMGITGWPSGAAKEAAQRCFDDWVQQRGGIGSGEVAEARRRIAEAIQIHGSSRFQRWHKSGSDRITVMNRMGFVKVDGNPDHEDPEFTHFFMAEPLKELLRGLDFRTVISTLMDEGVIVAHRGKPIKVYHVPALGKKHRLYEISNEALDGITGLPDE